MSNLMTEPRIREAALDAPEVRENLAAILRGQRSGVLCACLENISLCTQIPFVAEDDLRSIILVTPRSETKFVNMSATPNASFLVGTARQDPSDSDAALDLTVEAVATELRGEPRERAAALFARRHPDLAEFAAATENAVMELRVRSYTLVDRFQKTTRIALE
jgi:hypothetical protein